MSNSETNSTGEQVIARLATAVDGIREQLRQVVVGQDDVIDQLLISLFSRGHLSLIHI